MPTGPDRWKRLTQHEACAVCQGIASKENAGARVLVVDRGGLYVKVSGLIDGHPASWTSTYATHQANDHGGMDDVTGAPLAVTTSSPVADPGGRSP